VFLRGVVGAAGGWALIGRPEMTAAASATPQATSLYVYGVIPVADAR
jgi:hypothetical protein